MYKRQTERVYRKEMEMPVEDMKRFLDGILHIYDEGRTKVSMGDLFGIVAEAEARLTEKENSVAPWQLKMPIETNRHKWHYYFTHTICPVSYTHLFDDVEENFAEDYAPKVEL